jgi:RNA polymerase sigma-70 factor (ECF subfamily)
MRTVRDESAAEDLLQEVFLRVWTCAEQWDGRGTFKAWLFRIGTNQALNHLRTVRRQREQSLEIPPDETDDEEENLIPGWLIDTASLGPEAILERAEQRELLWRLVDALPDEKREVVHLVYEAEMELRQVASTLGVPEGTIKSRLHYAMKRLAREWKELALEWEES